MNLLDRTIAGLLPIVPRPIVRRFSARYIAGDNLESALATVRDLNGRGMMVTLDVLGEFITRSEEATATAMAYDEALTAIHSGSYDSNISIKLTSFGLHVDPDLCHRLVENLVIRAAECGNFIRIDMEDSGCTTDTLNLYRRLREKHDNVGVVLQAYLRRSMDDIESLLPLKPNVRVCKGIYVEPPELAFQDHDEINENYIRMIDRLLGAGCYVGIATHDEALVRAGFETVARLKLTRTQYEFQMLLGVTEGLRQSILDAGHRLRVYVPFGAQWYAYSVRRLKENPRIAGHVFRNLLSGFGGNGGR